MPDTANQKLSDFLDKLASSTPSDELMQEGAEILDAAVDESRQLQESINRASSAIANTKRSQN